MKRTRAYRQKQARKRKQLLGVGVCVCLCFVVLKVFDPFRASSEAPAVRGELKAESTVSMEMASGTDSGMIADQAPAEFAAAPMAPPSAEEAKADVSAAEVLSVTVICGSEAIELDVVDSAVIMEFLISDRWILSAANCLCDYTLDVSGAIYRYHSDCGTIQNESGESLTLSEGDKAIFNDIVSRCNVQTE